MYKGEWSSDAVSADVTDDGGKTLTGIGQTTVTVNDANLTDTSTAPATQPSAAEGLTTGTLTVATFTDANPSSTAADFTATIHWEIGRAYACTPATLDATNPYSACNKYADS